jgi:hypothetical protein
MCTVHFVPYFSFKEDDFHRVITPVAAVIPVQRHWPDQPSLACNKKKNLTHFCSHQLPAIHTKRNRKKKREPPPSICNIHHLLH